MGVPKLFSWLRNARNPLNGCVKNIDADSYRGDSVEVFLIDGNSLVHPQVSKVNSMKSYENEQEFLWTLFKAIDDEIDRLVKMIRPKHAFYFVMDGVPPQAKTVQQKQRRFLSATEAILNPQKKSGYVFDTNLISPGTDFMMKLDNHLRERFESFQKADSNYIEAAIYYPNRIVYSSHLEPGEGEHKIAEEMKKYPSYKRNAMIYGNDADLIMIFSILLKETKWLNIFLYRSDVDLRTGAPRAAIVDLHKFTILLECLFPELKPPITPVRHSDGRKSKKLMEQVNTSVHHFALLSYFLGNDFLPHMPSFQLIYSAIDTLVDGLRSFLNTNPYDHLTDRFTINWENVLKFLHHIKPQTNELLEKWATDPEYTNRLMNKQPHPAAVASTREVATISQGRSGGGRIRKFDSDTFRTKWYQWTNRPTPSEEIFDEVPLTEQGQAVPVEQQYKMSFSSSEPFQEDIDKMSLYFLQGMAWTFHYYVHGMNANNVAWFYPYHYAPLLTDLRNFMETKGEEIDSLVFEALRYRGSVETHANAVEHMLMVLPRRSVVDNKASPGLAILYDYDSPASKTIADTLPEMVASDWHGAMETYMGAVLCPNPDLRRVKKALQLVIGINYDYYAPVSAWEYRVTGQYRTEQTKKVRKDGKENISVVSKEYPRGNKEAYLGRDLLTRKNVFVYCPDPEEEMSSSERGTGRKGQQGRGQQGRGRGERGTGRREQQGRGERDQQGRGKRERKISSKKELPTGRGRGTKKIREGKGERGGRGGKGGRMISYPTFGESVSIEEAPPIEVINARPRSFTKF